MIASLMLWIHISMGCLGIIIACAAFTVKKRKGAHTTLGNIYHWLFALLAVSAIALSIMDWDRLWWFTPVALFSYAFALLGFLAGKIRWNNWIRLHLTGQGGSFIAMITAVMVVNFGTAPILAWFLPAALGTPVIIWLIREIKAGRRPKYG